MLTITISLLVVTVLVLTVKFHGYKKSMFQVEHTQQLMIERIKDLHYRLGEMQAEQRKIVFLLEKKGFNRDEKT